MRSKCWQLKTARDLLGQAGRDNAPNTEHKFRYLRRRHFCAPCQKRSKMDRAYGSCGGFKGWVLLSILSSCIGVTDATQVFNLGSELNAQYYTVVSTQENGK